MLEIKIVEIKRDACDIPLAVVDLKSKGESINEKMKKYSKIGMSNSDLPYEKNGPGLKEALEYPSPDVGRKKLSSKAGQGKTLYVKPQMDELSARIENDLNVMESKQSKFCDSEPDDLFEAFEHPDKEKIGTEALEGKVECHLVDKAKFDDEYLMTGFNTSSPCAGQPKELLELISLEVPLSPDDESQEFLELESIELQHSLVGDEEKAELGLASPMALLPQCCDTEEAVLPPLTAKLPLGSEAEKQPEPELPTAQLCLDDKINPLYLRVSQEAQEPMCAEDMRKSNCVECFDDQHRLPLHLHGKKCDPEMQNPEMEGNTRRLYKIMPQVLNLSNGGEEIVNPEDVWNGVPELDKSPPGVIFQTVGKDLYIMTLDSTALKEKGSEGDGDLTVEL
ncbi:Tudor domain-containing protein 6 [Manis javanica]|nr:Tudor domain-containing protein 6 [Manis javanica]